MADFCTKCSLKMFGDEKLPDIDVEKIFNDLEEGFCDSGFLCEGCGLVMIAKIEGTLKVMRIHIDENQEKQENNEWEDY